MSRTMMGFPIIIALIFFTGIEVEASPLKRCYEMMRFNGDIDSYIDSYTDSFMKLENEETLNLFCTNVTRYFMCLREDLKEHAGFTDGEMANVLEGADSGEYITFRIEREESVEEICNIEIPIQSGLEMYFPCFERRRMIPVKHCMGQSLLDYLGFTDLQPARELSEADNKCIKRAGQLGCVAATLLEKCGVESFNRYKTAIKKAGFFNRGSCSSDFKQTLKTTLLGFDMTESRKKRVSCHFRRKEKKETEMIGK